MLLGRDRLVALVLLERCVGKTRDFGKFGMDIRFKVIRPKQMPPFLLAIFWSIMCQDLFFEVDSALLHFISSATAGKEIEDCLRTFSKW